MRTPRQPTIKTLLLATTIYAAVFATSFRGNDEPQFGFGDDVIRIMQAAAILTWAVPFMLAFWIRSPIRVGIVCGVLGLLPLLGIWWIDSPYHERLLQWIVGTGSDAMLILYGHVFEAIIWYPAGADAFSISVFNLLPKDYQSRAMIEAFETAGAVVYCLMGFLISKTFRSRISRTQEVVAQPANAINGDAGP